MGWEDRDYILRLIREFGRLLRALRDAAGDGARTLLLEARCRSVCGMGLRAVDGTEAETLTELLPGEARLSLALLLTARAEVLPGHEERAAWQVKALRLMLASDEDDAVCEALAETADGLMRGVLDSLTAEDLHRCAAFFRRGGRIDLMDNAVFFLWETLPDKALWCGELAALYDGLTDGTLAACGLDWADVHESLSRLKDE